jgi:hypothetical protein
MNEIELKKIWDKLQGKLDVGTFDVFKSKMSDTESRKRFYDNYHDKLSDKGVELGDYKTYENTLSNPTTPSLPIWVPDCLKNNFDNLQPTNDNPPTQVIRTLTKSKWYFENPIDGKNRFIYKELSNDENIYGTWECQSDGNVLIKTNDGEQYSTKDKEWVKQPSTSSSTTQKKLGTIIRPDNPEVSDIKFTYEYPGDKNWRYGVKNGEWYARNRTTQNVFNISIVPEFSGSVANLKQKFPDALNSENSKESKQETNTSAGESNIQIQPKENQFEKMKQDADKLSKDIEFKQKYPTTPKDSIGGGQKVVDKPKDETIYNIEKDEL